MDLNTRIGHDQRDEAVRRLQDHLAEGRLEMAEFEERMGRALTARTIGELIDIFDDLPDEDWMISSDEPSRALAVDGPTADRPPAGRPADEAANGELVTVRVGPPGNPVTWALWLVPAAVAACWVTGIDLWPAIAVAVLVAVITLAGRARSRRDQGRSITYRKGDLDSEVRACWPRDERAWPSSGTGR
ncbi:DUF1707 SHOCT-like domain-containing protein [Aestuariimicrobium soli]|uniref:DUF1707 SHOCT-like domain-containing protein n=1 Tax=Aestuariimicrobium soli TaxID=2035834 RepID=UPI003EBB33B0